MCIQFFSTDLVVAIVSPPGPIQEQDTKRLDHLGTEVKILLPKGNKPGNPRLTDEQSLSSRSHKH